MKELQEGVSGLNVAMYLRGSSPRNPKEYFYLGTAKAAKARLNSRFLEFISIEHEDGSCNYFARRISGGWVHFTKDSELGIFYSLNPDVEYLHDIVP